LQNYFIVEYDAVVNAENSSVDCKVARRLAEFKLTREIIEEELHILDEAAKTDKTGWYKRTGWMEFFKDRNLSHLAYQLRLPGKHEPKLKLATELTELLIEKCVKGLSTLPHEIRRWLRSAKREAPDTRPLGRLQNPESQARYAGYIVKFVCFYLRIIEDERAQEARSSQETQAVNVDDLSEEHSDVESDDGDNSEGYRRRKRRAKVSKDPMKDARELFTWTDEQHRLADRLWDVLLGGERAVQMEALFNSLASFIFVKYPREPLSCGLIQFLAVLGIDGEIGRLRTAKNYSFMLAGVVYCIRVLGLETLLPMGQRDQQTEEDRQKFIDMREKYLADGSFSPMSEMINLLAMGKYIGLNAGNSGSASWSRDKKTFYLNGRPIVISQFCKMAQGLVADVTKMLWEICWSDSGEECFSIDLLKVVDDVTLTRRGISFVDHPANQLTDGLRLMLERAESTEGGRRLQRADGEWDVKAVRRYLRQVDAFLELLLCAKHIVSGQPDRGTGITSTRHRNGSLQDRNIFVIDGQIMTVSRYHKSQSQWDKPKVVPRFLPPQLGKVMAIYLVYVQPFREYLTLQVMGGNYTDYVWSNENGPWETDRLTRVLKRETGQRLGVPLHTLDYRHVAVGIGREKVGHAFSKGYDDDVGEVEEAEVEEDGEDVMELQNSRTTRMGVGNYAVPIDIVKHLSVRSIEAFRPLSMLWHQFLGVDGKLRREGEEERPAQIGEDRRQEIRKRPLEDCGIGTTLQRREKEQRIYRTRDEDVSNAMRRIFKKQDVGFRSVEQELAVHAVLDRQTPLVVVLPTGGGKSLLFMVAAMVETGGMTVVIVPYRALRANLAERMKASGIDCIEWQHGETNAASLVLVSADTAGDTTSNGNFLSYARQHFDKGVLRRIVVDECHLVYTSSDWRPKLAKLQNIRITSCPLVLLTATLPPIREFEFSKAMLLSHATYIRASTVRRYTQYLVSWCEDKKVEETALTMARRQQRLLLAKRQKGVVYCKGKESTEAMAASLGCEYYHADAPDRPGALEQWMEEGGLICATSALGTGVDIPGVLFTLHVKMPWSMTDFAQESGRGGREGETVESVILVGHAEVEETAKRRWTDIDVQAMALFLTGSGCRRSLMSGYLDSKGVTCGEVEAVGCDRCGEGQAKWMEARKAESEEWQRVRDVMDELREGCAICWLLSKMENGVEEGVYRKHRTMQCVQDADIDWRVVDDFRRGVRIDRDWKQSNSCFRCWVSQRYCATGEGFSNECQWPNVVMPLVRTAVLLEEGQQVVGRCGFEWKDEGGGFAREEVYQKWLGMRHPIRVWGEFFSNAMVVAIRVILEFSKKEEEER
jgi:superfamily II DNA helicase RecQ